MMPSDSPLKDLFPSDEEWTFHVLWRRKYVIDTFHEAEIIVGTIEATTLSQRVIADLECLEPSSNLLVGHHMTLFKQLQQHRVLMLQENQES